MKTCPSCGIAKPTQDFYKTRLTKDGLQVWCKLCQRAYARSEKGRGNQRRADAKRNQTEERRKNLSLIARQLRKLADYKQRGRAYKAVSDAIKKGDLPALPAASCSECGGKADHYHHTNGYSRKHRLDVVPVCINCHSEIHKGDNDHE